MSESLSVVVVPNKLRYINFVQKYLHPTTLLIQYRYDMGYSGILSSLSQSLGSRLVVNLAMVLYSTPFGVYICSNESRVQRFSYDCLLSSSLQNQFFNALTLFFDKDSGNRCRLDFLNCNLSSSTEIRNIITAITQSVQVPCGISKDLWGNDIIVEYDINEKRTAAEFYFANTNLTSFTQQQTMDNFEKIRIIGKGAFGTAVLYRKKDDDSVVILKEINMHDLSAVERQMAMNEVKVLSLLDHPNIVAYYDSFEEDGILIIEMEYADNGTLSQFLSNQVKPLEEKQILELFQQIVAALHYIHEHKILHRDLKTANIFLTKENVIKVGDFGISKMLTTTLAGAHSVIGTPHYISPEMCQGKIYNEKSDVWSLGCILYEMTCLHKTFEGSNLPAIVNKIIKCQFEEVKGNYSDELKELIGAMLQKNPDDRCSTDVILYHKVPMMLKKFETKGDRTLLKRDTRSVLYVMDIVSLSLKAVALPSRIRIKQVCSSRNHVVVLTSERVVYTWGNNKYGQLGHGDVQDRSRPDPVLNLSQKSLIRVACGTNFSIFGSQNGIIMTCGHGLNGCLGHGDFRDLSKPKLIESLLSVDITCISTTFEHVIVVTSDNSIYGWGSNTNGQLGLKNNIVYSSPQKISINEPVIIQNAFTSQDATMLLTDAGSILASGSNYGNKLGLNARLGFLMTMKSMAQQTCVDGVTEFTSVRALSRHRVNQISMGGFHTVVICQSGKVISFGVNVDGQLGNGHVKIVPIISEVKGLRKHTVTKIASGANYSVAYVNYNSLYFWGHRQISKLGCDAVRSPSTPNRCDADASHSNDGSENRNNADNNIPGSNNEDNNNSSKEYTIPVLILHLKNSKTDNPDKELVCLTDCITYGHCDLLVQIETTAPPPKRIKRRSRTVTNLKKIDSSGKKDCMGVSEYASARSLPIDREDTFDNESIPTWIKMELLAGVEPDNDLTLTNKSKATTSLHEDVSVDQSGSICGHKNMLRIYSSSDQNNQYSNCDKPLSNSSDTISLPTHRYRDVAFNRAKSESNFIANSTVSKDKEFEQHLNNLQIQLETQQHVVAKSTVLINKLQSEINRLHMERHGDNIDPGKHISTICIIQ